MIDVVDDEHKGKAGNISNILATYRKTEDLINIGAYVKGSNPEVDLAIDMIGKVNAFLTQGIDDKVSFEESKRDMFGLFE
jgi:flagellum-specific ATP synthase